jgi:hypothetical protein
MAEKRIRSETPAVYVATATFYVHGNQLVLAGHTVAAGHPILKGREALFRPFTPTWTLPGAKPEPPEAETTQAETEGEP